jgi:hypothetical protein
MEARLVFSGDGAAGSPFKREFSELFGEAFRGIDRLPTTNYLSLEQIS